MSEQAKRGRPVADPSGKQKACKVRLNPSEEAHLQAKYGSVNAGLRALVARDRKRNRA